MKLLKLFNGEMAMIDDDDYERLSDYNWHLSKRKIGCYIVRSESDGKVNHKIYLHREVMGAISGQQVDHKDRNFLNNQKSNLRFCTHSQNLANRKRKDGCVYRFRGTFKRYRKWGAAIKNSGKRYGLGSFETEREAAMAYDRAAIKFYGDFAVLNFPSSKI